ncbi:MAG: DEAD/DEAH box helicase family protein [Minisyncoccia bacterium]|jgi:type III restriction enzyme
MPQQFLHDEYDVLSRQNRIDRTIPDYLVSNLNPEFVLRPYQVEAFARFFDYLKNYEGKEYPIHLLFNMATGSGKTNIMAGLMLYLYKQGYRNFLFFVNSNTIISKTKNSFLNESSRKYIFNPAGITIDGKHIVIRPVSNFEDSNDHDINICFTTLQKLHGDLTIEKEGMLTYEDFKNKKVVLLSDEAHHTQKQTKQKSLGVSLEEASWENTVEKVFQQNVHNLLLEFTATMDFAHGAIVSKYRNKILYRYDLKQFRNDGYSKDPQILSSDTDKNGRMLQAIIVSQYRQEVATANGIYLKPVVLFKAQKTITQSEENKVLFHKLIGDLSAADIKEARRWKNEVLERAFVFFKEQGITDSVLTRKLKDGFAESKCLSVNDETQKEQNQILLNSLEDKDNQIRAIFAVQKLNEGWDVLNLFDIVRLYETRDSRNNKPGPTTIAEAQLIGRGARYYPFALSSEQDRYTRKYDSSLNSELRILEELHYHCHPGDKSRYIVDITNALIQTGLLDEQETVRELRLKESFRETKFYKSGVVFANERKKRCYNHVRSFDQLGVKRKNISYTVFSGMGAEEGVFADRKTPKATVAISTKDVKVADIEPHVVRAALSYNDFFSFSNFKQYIPGISSLATFATDPNYIAGLSITFRGSEHDLEFLDNRTKFAALMVLLADIEAQMKEALTEYEGTESFLPQAVRLVFTDKKVKVRIPKETIYDEGRRVFLEDKPWYVFETQYGTSEEDSLVDLIGRYVSDFKKEFREVYLVRNERQLKIYNFSDGRGFEPDYLLFLIGKKGQNYTYQLFIEPKGQHLREYDLWKDQFLEEIRTRFKDKIFTAESKTGYRVIGVPFYNSENENEFVEKMLSVL